MIKDKIVFFEIILIVMGTIAFTYNVAGIFELVESASAQENDPSADIQQYFEDEGINVNPENQDELDEALDQAGNIGDSLGGNNFGERSFLFDIIDNFVPDIPLLDRDIWENALLESSGGIKTCTVSNDREICQEFSGNECVNECSGTCLEGARSEQPEGSECAIGTCYFPEDGFCMPRSSLDKCESDGGTFNYGKLPGSIVECTRGCCILDSEAFFSTGRRCEKMAEDLGVELGIGGLRFDSELDTELSCLGSVYNLEEGACVISTENGKDCKFVTAGGCNQLTGSLNSFHEGWLCSNPGLDTICEEKSSSGCVDGLDEVYWFDSCGNRENIYDSEDDSWNGGEVLAKEDSCFIGDNLEDQGTCGNCNRLQGSFCGEKTDRDSLDDEAQGYVCIDMSCDDDEVGRKEHGESWCAYQSSIGVPGPDELTLDTITMFTPFGDLGTGINRATDTPGSRHFRKVCLNGEVRTTQCGDFRNEVCLEGRTEGDTGEDFSQATCRINRWQECLAYNPGQGEAKLIGSAGGDMAQRILQARLAFSCGPDPDCFIKTVNVDKSFQFSYCAPRYPPGFEIDNFAERDAESSSGEQFCAQGNQACTAVFVKKIGGWKCESNCDCVDWKSGDNLPPKPSLPCSLT